MHQIKTLLQSLSSFAIYLPFLYFMSFSETVTIYVHTRILLILKFRHLKLTNLLKQKKTFECTIMWKYQRKKTYVHVATAILIKDPWIHALCRASFTLRYSVTVDLSISCSLSLTHSHTHTHIRIDSEKTYLGYTINNAIKLTLVMYFILISCYVFNFLLSKCYYCHYYFFRLLYSICISL